MDRLLNMILNMVLRRGVNSLLGGGRKKRARGDDRGQAQGAEAQETQKRMRQTQKMMRRMGR